MQHSGMQLHGDECAGFTHWDGYYWVRWVHCWYQGWML